MNEIAIGYALHPVAQIWLLVRNMVGWLVDIMLLPCHVMEANSHVPVWAWVMLPARDELMAPLGALTTRWVGWIAVNPLLSLKMNARE